MTFYEKNTYDATKALGDNDTVKQRFQEQWD